MNSAVPAPADYIRARSKTLSSGEEFREQCEIMASEPELVTPGDELHEDFEDKNSSLLTRREGNAVEIAVYS